MGYYRGSLRASLELLSLPIPLPIRDWSTGSNRGCYTGCPRGTPIPAQGLNTDYYNSSPRGTPIPLQTLGWSRGCSRAFLEPPELPILPPIRDWSRGCYTGCPRAFPVFPTPPPIPGWSRGCCTGCLRGFLEPPTPPPSRDSNRGFPHASPILL